MTTTWTLSIDCADVAVVAAFWKGLLGYVDAPPPVGFASWDEWFERCEVPVEERGDGAALVDPEGRLPRLSLLRVPEAKVTKNRLHLDLQVSGGRHRPAVVRRELIGEHVRRAVRLGARVVGEHTIDGELDHVVLADPEGNEFCVV